MVPKNILIVDDDPAARELIKSLLESNNYVTSAANDGLDALNALKKGNFDLVVLDVMMPEINGYDVCYQLRFNPDFEQTPIILVTSRERELDEQMGRRANIVYCQKPIHAERFLSEVASLLNT